MTAPINPNYNSLPKLRKLYDRARRFATSFCDDDHAPCKWFYRNKSEEYFQSIHEDDDGLMKVVLKDGSGDPGSPINHSLSGLFFIASVQTDSKCGEPLPKSPFGPCRLLVPVHDLLTMDSNVYFADFYCMGDSEYHYVTLVMTDPDSEADKFCAKFLLGVDIYKNPFLFIDKFRKLRVTTKYYLFVEIFYTEDLDIRQYKMRHNIQRVGKGHSTHGGIPKNIFCDLCNV